MPSKSKKHSKLASRLPNADQSASPQTPSFYSTQELEEDLELALEDASLKYPNLIGKSAFIVQVSDVVEPVARGCKIWLSESSMLSSSLTPGSVVSVSLAGRFSGGFPLSSFSCEYTRKCTVESLDEIDNQVGNYFALANVFPSCKVSKNGVLLSSSLSYTMGCPTSGRAIFVYPIQNQALGYLVSGNDRPQNKKVDSLPLHGCSELYLELVHFTERVKMNGNMISAMNLSSQKRLDQSENGMMTSPKTPLSQPKLSSPSPSQLASPRCGEVVSNLSIPNGTYSNSLDVEEALKDEGAKQVIQTCATSWLCSRIMLCGNLVTIPLLSKLCIFRVTSAKLLADSANQVRKEGAHNLYPEASEPMDHGKDAFIIDHETKVYFYPPVTPQTKGSQFMKTECGYRKPIVGHDISKLGGLSNEYAVLKDIIVSSTKSTLTSFGLQTTKGVLLHGPTGTGKTSLARLCVIDAGVNLFSVNGPEIISQYYGESEQTMHEVFDSACQAAPAVVFIDELDAIAPERKDGGEELSQRMVATLLNLMDGINGTNGVLVIAATNRPDSVEPALRRPGRLDREIEIGVPSPKQRLDILQSLLREMEHSLSDIEVQHLATATHGFVGADLAALCNEAALVCLRRYAKSNKSCSNPYPSGSHIAYESSIESRDTRDCADSTSFTVPCLPVSREIPSSFCSNGTVLDIANSMEIGVSTSSKRGLSVEEEHMLKVVFEDFEKARMKVRPSAMREVVLEVPKVNWEDVGGQREAKTQLMEAVEWPQRHQDAFKRIGTRPPTGVLMFGPPGCSKTLMARAVASEAGLNFLAVKGPELFSKWVGESEKAVRSLFAKARANAPSIIFFDEIDALAVIRGKESDGVSVSDRVMSQLLVELDGLHQRVDVTVIAATNRPDKIDPALLRPGRFDRLLYVGPPNESDREDIFHIHLRKIPCSSDVNIKDLARLTDGCTGADISLICREAAIAAIEENIDASKVTMQHLKTAIRQVPPSDISSYEELSAKFQRLVHTSDNDELRNQRCTSSSNGFSIWTLIKSTMQLLLGFPASGSKSTSVDEHISAAG